MKKLLVLFTFALCLWVNETSAQLSCPTEENIIGMGLSQDVDGSKGVLVGYDHAVSPASINEVRVNVGSCTYTIHGVRGKTRLNEKAVFIPSDDFTESVDKQSILYKGGKVLGFEFVCHDPRASVE